MALPTPSTPPADVRLALRAKGVLQALQVALEKDSEPVVRQEVAACLGRMGEDAKDAIPNLAFALGKDKDDKTRELAGRALLQMVPYSKKALTNLESSCSSANDDGVTLSLAAANSNSNWKLYA